jgi:hypothetical protein
MAYLLDSDVFLQAKNRHYGLDFCPAFWDWIDAQHAAGRIFSIEKVRDELLDLDIAAWAGARPAGFFLPVDAAATAAMGRVSAWTVAETRFTAGARTDFFSKADYYLVSQALAGGHTVVTHEQAAPASTTKVKIPDACTGMGVQCTNIFRLLRDSGARFVLP